MNNTKKQNTGFTLIEAVIYGAILTIITVVVVGGLLRLGTAYAKIQNTRKINEVGAFALERVIREVRKVDEDGFDGGITDGGNKDTIEFSVEASFADVVKADGAIAHWDFNDVGGGVADNLGPNDGEVRNINQTRRVPAFVDFGYQFTSDNHDEVNFPDDAFNDNTEGAIEVIFSPDSPEGTGSGYSPLFTLSQEGSAGLVNQAIFVGLNNKKILVAKRRSGFSWQELWFNGATPIVGGNYYHAVFETNNTINKTELYINGQKDTPYLHIGWPIGSPNNDNSSWFDSFPDLHNYAAGSFVDPTSNGPAPEPERTSFNGVIDEIVIYDIPKSEAVWASHYDIARLGEGMLQKKSIYRTIH